MTVLLHTQPAAGLGPAYCDSYEPGHRLHWSLWSMAQFAPAVVASHLRVDGTRVAVDIAGQHAFDWQHHDPDHLVFALRHAVGEAYVCPAYRVLHVDGAWFGCAPGGAELAACG